jgi:hypothetical protein
LELAVAAEATDFHFFLRQGSAARADKPLVYPSGMQIKNLTQSHREKNQESRVLINQQNN